MNLYIKYLFLAILILSLCSCGPDENYGVDYYPERTVVTTTAVEETELTVEETFSNVNTVYITPTGKKYHYSEKCAGKNAIEAIIDDVLETKSACKKCVK